MRGRVSGRKVTLSSCVVTSETRTSVPTGHRLSLCFLHGATHIVISVRGSAFAGRFSDPLMSKIAVFSRLRVPTARNTSIARVGPCGVSSSGPGDS